MSYAKAPKPIVLKGVFWNVTSFRLGQFANAVDDILVTP